MYKNIVKTSIISKARHNSTQIYTISSKQTIINTIMTAETTAGALQLSVVTNPTFTMFVQIVSKHFSRLSSKRIEIFSAVVV